MRGDLCSSTGVGLALGLSSAPSTGLGAGDVSTETPLVAAQLAQRVDELTREVRELKSLMLKARL